MNILERTTNYHLTAVIVGALVSAVLCALTKLTSGDWAAFNSVSFGVFLGGGALKEAVTKWAEKQSTDKGQ